MIDILCPSCGVLLDSFPEKSLSTMPLYSSTICKGCNLQMNATYFSEECLEQDKKIWDNRHEGIEWINKNYRKL